MHNTSYFAIPRRFVIYGIVVVSHKISTKVGRRVTAIVLYSAMLSPVRVTWLRVVSIVDCHDASWGVLHGWVEQCKGKDGNPRDHRNTNHELNLA